MNDETTSEQLAEIEGQGEDTPATEYTPPDGWRVVRFGELLLPGDVWVNWEGTEARPDILHGDGTTASGGRYIRRIKPEPQPEPQPEKIITPDDVAPDLVGQQLVRGLVLQVAAAIEQQETVEQPQPVQVREGRWRTRGGEVRNVTPTPKRDGEVLLYPWWDRSKLHTWTAGGQYHTAGSSKLDLVKYLGPIEQPEKTITPDDVAGEALAGVWDQVQAEQQIAELQGQLGEAKRCVVELETLVTDLRTINDAQEKAVRSAGRENTDLQHRLDVVSKEWAEQAATISGLQQQLEAVKAELMRVSHDRYQLQIELDAAQQVPTSTEDRFEQGWDAGTARAVETIAEWLEPLRKGNTTLRAAVFYHLPHIMRNLTGLTPED